jgi:hypothetical protein
LLYQFIIFHIYSREPLLSRCGVKLHFIAFNRNLTHQVKTPSAMEMKNTVSLIQVSLTDFSIHYNPMPIVVNNPTQTGLRASTDPWRIAVLKPR